MPQAIATQLETALGPAVDGVQISPLRLFNPSPPCLDIYPADPFLAQSGFGAHEAVWTIRARVLTADNEAGQELLLDLLDPSSAASVRAALRADPTFGGTVDDSGLEEGGPEATGYRIYRDTDASVDYLGCEWALRTALV